VEKFSNPLVAEGEPICNVDILSIVFLCLLDWIFIQMARLEAIIWEWTYFPYLFVSFIVFYGFYGQIPGLSSRYCPTFNNLSYDKQVIWHT